MVKKTKKMSGEKPNGRPRFVFDLEKVAALAKIQCTDGEICAVLGCSEETLFRGEARDPKLAQVIADGRAQGRASLRRKQFHLAIDGNPTMLIWLGKQTLGQKDRQDHEISGPAGAPLIPPEVHVHFVMTKKELE